MSGGVKLFALILIFQSMWAGLDSLANIIMSHWC